MKEVKKMGKPEQRFRCGAREAAVYGNEISRGGAKVKIKKVSLQKRYTAADGQ
jgi:hypothetical protein